MSLQRQQLPGVDHVVAIASGKGGVGKTTITVNLALALQLAGNRVGVFDADVYGPNVPLMLGIHQRRQRRETYVPVARPAGMAPSVPPLERFGLKLMSTGLLMGEEQVINPPPDAVGQMVVQTLRDVDWRALDFLLLDLPPSAGQPQEDLLRHVRMSGVVIVTTPQDLSLLDAGRSLHLFKQAGVPVLGIVENMSYFVCPDCGGRHEIFQRSERWRPAALASAPILGRIPLTPAISQSINRANPLVHEQPDSHQAAAFRDIAATLQELLASPPAL
jgi:ATP-binding protein involved in chromosome partitioning